jgi:hypothetical protein
MERIECVDDRSLLVANHPHFFEVDAHRQIFGDIADVLVLVRPDRGAKVNARRTFNLALLRQLNSQHAQAGTCST